MEIHQTRACRLCRLPSQEGRRLPEFRKELRNDGAAGLFEQAAQAAEEEVVGNGRAPGAWRETLGRQLGN
ncbi:MAG: hypothetical protein ABIO94_01755, partial [Opitutaceae bacterium]